WGGRLRPGVGAARRGRDPQIRSAGRIRHRDGPPRTAGAERPDHRSAAEPEPGPPAGRGRRAQTQPRRTARADRGHDHPAGERGAARPAQGPLPGPQDRSPGRRGGARRRRRARTLSCSAYRGGDPPEWVTLGAWAPMSPARPKVANSGVTPTTSPPASPRTGATATRWSRAATG